MKSRASRSSSVARLVSPSSFRPLARARVDRLASSNSPAPLHSQPAPKTQPSSPRRTTPWRTVRSSRIVAKAPASFRPRPKVSPRARSTPLARPRLAVPSLVLPPRVQEFLTHLHVRPARPLRARRRVRSLRSVVVRQSSRVPIASSRASSRVVVERFALDSRRVASREFRRARSRTSSVDREVAHRASRRSIAPSPCAGRTRGFD